MNLRERIETDAVDVSAQPSRQTILFDFDGVLVRGDSFGQFLRERIHASPWRHALALLAWPVAMPLMRTQRGLPTGARIFGWVARIGTPQQIYLEQLREFALRIARDPRHVIATGMQVLRDAQASGARVVVVSGNHESAIRDILVENGLSDVEIVASRQYPRRRHCIGAAKIPALAEAGVVPPWDIAYSDSLMDLPMLRGARRPVLVNARAAHVERASVALGRTPELVHWR